MMPNDPLARAEGEAREGDDEARRLLALTQDIEAIRARRIARQKEIAALATLAETP